MKYGIVSWLTVLEWVRRFYKGVLVLLLLVGLSAGIYQTNEWFKTFLKNKERVQLAEKQAVLGAFVSNTEKEKELVEAKIEYWEKILSIQPGYSPAYERLAIYHEALGNSKEAQKYDKLLKTKLGK